MHTSLARVAVAAALLVTVPAAAHAQKRWVKGIPCSGTCISATKTCHVGAGSATRAPAPRPATPAPATRSGSSSPRRSTAGDRGVGPIDLAADTTARWIAQEGGAVYYLRTCDAAAELPSEQLVLFAAEAEAQRAGLRRSKVAGC